MAAAWGGVGGGVGGGLGLLYFPRHPALRRVTGTWQVLAKQSVNHPAETRTLPRDASSLSPAGNPPSALAGGSRHRVPDLPQTHPPFFFFFNQALSVESPLRDAVRPGPDGQPWPLRDHEDHSGPRARRARRWLSHWSGAPHTEAFLRSPTWGRERETPCHPVRRVPQETRRTLRFRRLVIGTGARRETRVPEVGNLPTHPPATARPALVKGSTKAR